MMHNREVSKAKIEEVKELVKLIRQMRRFVNVENVPAKSSSNEGIFWTAVIRNQEKILYPSP